jgi:uncharacterized Fe-S radical SAM superfamily protein PflX
MMFDFKRNTEKLYSKMDKMFYQICPRKCGANRGMTGRKVFMKLLTRCLLQVLAVNAGEKPSISVSRGSASIFFQTVL